MRAFVFSLLIGIGAFIATGIESSFPFAHSRVSASPVDFAWSLLDGVGRVIVEDTDRTSGMTPAATASTGAVPGQASIPGQ